MGATTLRTAAANANPVRIGRHFQAVPQSGQPATEDSTQAVIEIHTLCDKPTSDWPPWAMAAVHPVTRDGRQPCFGVTLDQRKLCGSGGRLTLFDSMAAANRFLQSLNVHCLVLGAPFDRDIVAQDRPQCFRLGPSGLAPCGKCLGRMDVQQPACSNFREQMDEHVERSGANAFAERFLQHE